MKNCRSPRHDTTHPPSNRLLQSVVTLLGVSVLVFVITHAIPADPVAAVAGPKADAETRERIRKELGLNDPLWEQYGRYLWDVLHGDLGKSFVTGERVTDAILIRFPSTLFLSLGGVAIWLIVGVPLGVLTAKFRDKPIDRITLVLAMVAHLAADVLAGPAAAIPVRLPRRPFARGRILRLAMSDSAVDHARRGRGRLLRPPRPQQHGGGVKPGLHPRRPRPRPVGAGGAVQARPAQRPDPGADRARPGHRRAAGRRRLHREHLRPARPGGAGPPGGADAGRADDYGHRAVRGGAGRRRQHHRGRGVSFGGPAHSIQRERSADGRRSVVWCSERLSVSVFAVHRPPTARPPPHNECLY